ncbi:hypothetical protein BOO86_00200 [Mycobacterium sp. CBMA 234]|uniref:DUF7159 family protein n=1 Tax=Mycolicibacterium sp. CBMA 234 TaxID=1918495 RepID=UPI0012DC104E|nr:hypothetical protein [Mycolicibacterium sp. CBMA 234]MUL62866.1 hypothetical protein [Mycolicibacterium sp. CBMA 234]
MDAVLGMAMTPSSIGFVLVEGNDVDGFTMDHDAFEIMNTGDATEAVLRSEALAATRGLRLKSIGLTWSDDADAEASKLIQSLSDSGFDNVVPVRFPEATEAVARGIADALDFPTTAVCAIEPDIAITMIVHGASGAVHTAVNHTVKTENGLTSWLSSVFARADWQPDALVVIGSAGNFDAILPGLQSALSVPVFTPEESELALARGAALVSVQSGESGPYYYGDVPRPDEWDGLDSSWDPGFDPFDSVDEYQHSAVAPVGRHRPSRSSRWQQVSSSQTLPLAMLAVGSTAFVASVSMAATLQFLPTHQAPASSTVKAPRPAAAEQAVAPVQSATVAPTDEPAHAVPVESSQSEQSTVDQQAAPVTEPEPAMQPEGLPPAPADAPPAATDIPPAAVPPNSIAVAVPAEATAPVPADVAPPAVVPPAEPAAPPQ